MVPYISGIYGAPAATRVLELPSLVENDGYFISCSLMDILGSVYDPGLPTAEIRFVGLTTRLLRSSRICLSGQETRIGSRRRPFIFVDQSTTAVSAHDPVRWHRRRRLSTREPPGLGDVELYPRGRQGRAPLMRVGLSRTR